MNSNCVLWACTGSCSHGPRKRAKGSHLGVVDVHYHLIFGVDDGPKTIEDSLALAEASIAEGVTHVVATPHANDHFKFDPEINREKLAAIGSRLAGRLNLGMGCDFHLSFDNLVQLERDPYRYSINGKQYILVEFADYTIPSSLLDILFRMRSHGLTPIVTHPERNPILLADLDKVNDWVMNGCLVQITAGSLCGDFGNRTKAAALHLLRSGLVHLVASDAHAMKWRPPSMRRAHEFLARDFGAAEADRLCIANPRAVFLGEQLSAPAGPRVEDQAPRRGLLGRLFGGRGSR